MVTGLIKRQSAVRKKLGKSIKRARKRARLSQVDLGQAIGKSSWMIELMERGEKNLTLGTISNIAHATGTIIRFDFTPLRKNVNKRLCNRS